MERKFFSGNTIEQAVMAAARHYGLDPSRVAYSSRDKKHGFLNIRRRVVIEVDPSAPELPEAPPAEPGDEAGGDTAAASPAEASGAPAESSPGDRDPRPRRSPRGDEPRHDGPHDEPRHEEPRHEEPRHEEPRREEPRHEEPRRDEPRRDEPRHHEPRHHEPRHARRHEPRDEPRDEPQHDEHDDEMRRYRQEQEGEFAEEVSPETPDEAREIAAFEKALDEVVELIEMELEATVTKRDDLFEIELKGEDGEFIVERDGLLLRAIEHLLPRMVRGLLGYGLPCRVDCDGFQEAREAELGEIAGGMAELARRQGKPQKLEPMTPADRRLVHLALADDPTVDTESEGSGYMKRVKIRPA